MKTPDLRPPVRRAAQAATLYPVRVYLETGACTYSRTFRLPFPPFVGLWLDDGLDVVEVEHVCCDDRGQTWAYAKPERYPDTEQTRTSMMAHGWEVETP